MPKSGGESAPLDYDLMLQYYELLSAKSKVNIFDPTINFRISDVVKLIQTFVERTERENEAIKKASKG